MNLPNTLAVIGMVLFVISIVRGCGGMMPGGCGMGSHSRNQQRPHHQHDDTEVE